MNNKDIEVKEIEEIEEIENSTGNDKHNELRGRIRKHISFFRDINLTLMVVLMLAILYLYGVMLEDNGYEYAGEKPMSTVALAINEISNGNYPWTMVNLNVAKEAHTNNHNNGEVVKPEKLNIDLYIAMSGSAGNEQQPEEGNIDSEENIDLDENEIVDEEPEEFHFVTVDDSYFDDAVFLGDSRMVGVAEYAGMDNATFYAKTSLTIYGLLDSNATTDPTIYSVRQGLTDNQFGKVYIMVGINEIGTGEDTYFTDHYMAVIDEIKALQPDAIIYIQGILHVAHARSSSDPYVNNTNIDRRNAALAELADNETIFYIDVNPIFDDENGELNAEYTFDSVHLLANQYEAWHQFFLENGVER